MPVKKYNPTSPGMRSQSGSTFEEITRSSPEKSLLSQLNRSSGRNRYGRVTSRHRGGGHKRRYRLIDFKRDKFDVAAKVASIEYDPNRSARIALLNYADGEKRYIIAPIGLKVGDMVVAGERVDIKIGNALPLSSIPLGTIVHNVELAPGRGAQIARSAGTYVQLMAKEGKYANLRMPSSEVRRVPLGCMATIGQVGNTDKENITIGKAGRSRWLGKRPHVRGSAMNPCDHPHGGGEGRSPRGRHPVSPWGQLAKGYKTRKKKKSSDELIIRRRKS